MNNILFKTKYRDGMSMLSKKTKRFLDILFSALSLLLFLIPMLIIGLMIKLEDGGPIIFKQERMGYKGHFFMLYKFRSMLADTDTLHKNHLCEDNDKFLTKIGGFIRRHHLDEFPQLWNILVGDMSFVGPRPERVYFIKKIKETGAPYDVVLNMRPGIFSEATLYNGYTDTLDKMLKRLKMDLEYYEKRNLFLDVRIIFLTSWSIVSGKKF